jgi:predicted transcriptional regulator
MVIKGKKVMVSMRMDPECITRLDEAAKELKISRSKLIRDLARNAGSFYQFIVSQKARQQAESIALDGNLATWILQNCPPGTDSRLLHFLSSVMHLAAESKEVEEKRGK